MSFADFSAELALVVIREIKSIFYSIFQNIDTGRGVNSRSVFQVSEETTIAFYEQINVLSDGPGEPNRVLAQVKYGIIPPQERVAYSCSTIQGQ